MPLSGRTSLPWTPLLALLGATGLGLALARARGRGAALATLLLAAGLLWASFTLSWGLLYRRARVPELLALPEGAATSAELSDLADELLARVRADAAAPADEEAAVAALGRAFAGSETSAGTAPRRVKQLPAGALTTFGYAGVVSPWTLEAHVDGGLPTATRVAVAAHELAHLGGWAHEADADLVGALAGLAADHPYARYATALALLGRLLPRLPEAEREALREALPPRARRDLEAAREAAKRYYRPALARPIGALYERYLRASGIDEGSEAYRAVLDLLVRARRAGLLDGAPGAR